LSVGSSPAPSPASKALAPAGPRSPGDIINDIQRELSHRGYYDGPVDGFYGPRTDAAIREFERRAGLKASTEPSEAFLASIKRAPINSKTPVGAPPIARPQVTVPHATPAPRVMALQRALADYGYGQIKPSGLVDLETQRAIEKFERERKLPVTGQPSERVMREMTAMTGRAFN
jgi:peptidoglycan hydrolase-like protein with peptidoglycan-binding domain